MIGVRVEDSLQVTAAEDEDVVEALPATEPTHRSGKAFAFGARTGVFATVSPSVRRTSSKGPENLASRSRRRMCLFSTRPVVARFRACWVTQAESGRLVAPATWTRLVESSMKKRT
jgi:hypothetical protein